MGEEDMIWQRIVLVLFGGMGKDNVDVICRCRFGRKENEHNQREWGMVMNEDELNIWRKRSPCSLNNLASVFVIAFDALIQDNHRLFQLGQSRTHLINWEKRRNDPRKKERKKERKREREREREKQRGWESKTNKQTNKKTGRTSSQYWSRHCFKVVLHSF